MTGSSVHIRNHKSDIEVTIAYPYALEGDLLVHIDASVAQAELQPPNVGSGSFVIVIIINHHRMGIAAQTTHLPTYWSLNDNSTVSITLSFFS